VAIVTILSAGCGPTIEAPKYPTSEQVAADHRAVGIPYGRVILLRSAEQVVALRVTWASPIGEQIRYEWYAAKSGETGFVDALNGEGAAQEDRFTGRIAAGPWLLTWSRGSRDMGWIYWPDDGGELAVCSRAWESLDQADPNAAEVLWYTREMFE
jgi:hypothetical protein